MSGPSARRKPVMVVFVARACPVDSVRDSNRRGRRSECSNALLIGRGECWCWRRRKRACSTTASSAPSTSSSASSTRARALPPRHSSSSGSRSKPCARRSRRPSGCRARRPTGSPPFTPRAKKVLELSLREALQLGHNYIGTEHMLLGLVREGEGVAAQVLVSLGADLAQVRQQVIQLLSGYQGKESVGAGPGRRPPRPRRGRRCSTSSVAT